MPNDGDAQILQILRREDGKESFRNSVVAESGLVLLKAKARNHTANSMTASSLGRSIQPRVALCLSGCSGLQEGHFSGDEKE